MRDLRTQIVLQYNKRARTKLNVRGYTLPYTAISFAQEKFVDYAGALHLA